MSRTATSPLHRVDRARAMPSRRGAAMRGSSCFEHVAQVADQRHVDLDVLVDLGRIDLDVDLLRVGRVGGEVAGDAVVEAHAEGDQQVGLLDRVVDPRLAVHAHHAEVERMRRREAAEAEQRAARRESARARRSASTCCLGARLHDAVAGEDHRPLCGAGSARWPA